MIHGALHAWEAGLAEHFPDVLDDFRPGLSAEQLHAFRAELAPWTLPDDVAALYAWRDGGDHGAFAGWRLVPMHEVLNRREFYQEIGDSPAWLHVFDDQTNTFVELGAPSQQTPRETAVWAGHMHSGWVSKYFTSVAGLVWTCTDALFAGELVQGRVGHALRLSGRGDLDGEEMKPHRLERNPRSFVWPGPPRGTHVGRFPHQRDKVSWPDPWLERYKPLF